MRKTIVTAAFIAAALFSVTPQSSAVCSVVLTVTNNNDSGAGSLRAAITTANAGSCSNTSIVWAPSAGGTISLASALPVITQGVTIDASGTSSPVTIDGQNQSRIFFVGDGATTINVAIKNLAAINGLSQGGKGGDAASAGGGGLGAGAGIFVNSNANVTVTNVTFDSNAAKGGNGGNVTAATTNGGGGGGMDYPGSTANGQNASDPNAFGFGNGGGPNGGAGDRSGNASGGGDFSGGGAGIGFAGNGGFGGGGGGSYNHFGGTGGFGGGNGGGNGFIGSQAGSGGSGFGGGIFVRQGGTLTYAGGTIGGGNTASAGTAGTGGSFGASNGNASGAGLYTMASDVNFAGNTTVAGAITVQGNITQTGPGTLALLTPNTISGNTTVTSAGTVQVADQSALGQTGSNSNILTLNNGTLQTTAFNAWTHNITLGAGGGTWDTQNSDHEMDGVLSGPGSFTKTGNGTLYLTNTNTYQGGTSINGGTLNIQSDANLGQSGTTVSMSGGTLQFANDATTNHAMFLNFNGGTLDTQSHSVTVNGNISGLGGLTKEGNGFLTLGGNNSYFGNTTINGGAISIDNDSRLGIGGNVTLSNGGALLATADITSNRAIQLTNLGGGITSDNHVTLNGVVSGDGSLTKQGAGTLLLNQTNTYAGGTYIGHGTVQLGATNALGSGTVSMFNGSSLVLGGNNTRIGSLEDDASGTTVDLGAGTLTTGWFNTDTTYSGTISGTGSLTKEGAGTFTLAGNNSYGATTINGGALSIGSASNLGSGPLTLNNGTLQTTGFGNIFLAQNVSLGTSGGTFDVEQTNGTSDIVFGTVSGGGDLTKTGVGDLELSAPNNYTGATHIDGGSLTVFDASGLGNGSSLTFDGGTLKTLGSTNFNQTVMLNAFGGTFDTNGNTIGLNSDVNGFGGLTKAGAGTLQLNHSTSYSGATEVSQGALQATTNGALSSNSAFDVASGGLLLLGGFDQTIGSLSGNGLVDMGGQTLTMGGNNMDTTFSGTIAGLGSGTIVKNGIGTLTLSGLNSYAGGTTINGGTISISDNSNLGGPSGPLTLNGGTLQTTGSTSIAMNRFVTLGVGNGTFDVTDAAQTVTLQQTVSGPGSLVKNGAGVLELASANAYGSQTTINAGTLQVDNDNALGASIVHLNGGTLAGHSGPSNQTLANNIVVDPNGGTIATGINNGIHLNGTVSGGGNLTLQLNSGNIFMAHATNTGVTHITGSGGSLVASADNAFSLAGAYSLDNAGAGLATNGHAETIGSLSGTAGSFVALDGALTVGLNNANSTFSGNIYSNGLLIKTGTGILTLAGTNSYTGGTIVGNGTLQGDTTSLQGDIENDSRLAFNQSTDGTYGGTMGGSGSLEVSGPGMLTLTNGNNSYAGGTRIVNGALQIDQDAELGNTTGGVTLSAGTLKFAGDVSSLRATSLASGVNTFDANGHIVNWDGDIQGNGGLHVTDSAGAGVLALGGHNSYTGGTLVDAGALLSGNSDSLQGTIENHGTLNFSQVGTVGTYAGSVSGDGGVSVSGDGELTLANANTFTGPLALFNTVTLDVSSDQNLGDASSLLAFVGNNTLKTLAGFTTSRAISLFGNGTIDTNGFDSTLAGLIDGAGSLTKTGAGTLILTSNNTYSGGTTLNGGTLEVLGQGLQTSAASRPLIVASAASPITSVFGTGDFALTNGTLKVDPDHFGTIGVGGNYTQTGGTLELKLGGGHNTGVLFDQLAVGGTAHFGGTLKLDVVGGTFTPGTGVSLQLVQAGGYAGAFDIVSNGAALGFSFDPTTGVGTAAGTGTVSVTQLSFAPFATTANQQAVAANVDTFAKTATGDLNTLVAGLDSLSATQLPSAFNELSPQRFEAFSDIAFRTAAFTSENLDSHLARLRSGVHGLDVAGMLPGASQSPEALLADASVGRSSAEQWDFPGAPLLASASGGQGASAPGSTFSITDNLGAFVSGNAIFGNQDATTDLQKSNFTTSGTMGGLDYRLSDTFVAGVLFSYAHTSADLDNEGSTSDINSYAPGVYGAYFDGPVYVNSAFSWSRNTYSSDRNILFAGINRTAHSDTHGNQYALNTDGGYDFHVDRFNVGPTVALDYVHLDVDGFTETGANAADLIVKSQGADSLRTRLGTKLNRPVVVKSVTLVPEIRAAWQHEYLDDSRAITAQFSDPAAGPFSVNTSNPERDSALLGAGVTAQLTKTVDLYLNYDAQVGQKNFTAQGVQGGGRLRF